MWVVFLILGGCATYHHFYYNADKSVDFNHYRTFAWAPDSIGVNRSDSFRNTAYDNDIVRNNAKNFITYRLTGRGYVVNIDSPDLVLQLELFNERMQKIVTYDDSPYLYSNYYLRNRYYYPYYYPYYNYYTWNGWYGWGYPYGGYTTTTYKKVWVKGTITINMYDRKLKKLVWTGSAEGDIYDPAYIQYDVHPAIDRLLKKFPGKPGPGQDLKPKNRIVRVGPDYREGKSHH